jgi:hypothetical protein
LSEGTSCFPKVFNSLTGETASTGYFLPTFSTADMYQKYCICGLEQDEPTPAVELEFDPLITG